MNNNNRPDYRYERKFFVGSISRSEVEMIIRMNSFGFSEIYRERFINNIYFDTPILTSYFDNIEGHYNKKKTRVRWYGDLLGEIENSNLELKIKRGDLGQKKTYPLKSFRFNIGCDYKYLANLLIEVDFGNELKTKGLRPTLVNRYKRKYFQSSNKKFRITLDTDLSYYSVANRKI